MRTSTSLSKLMAFLLFFHLGCHGNKQDTDKDNSIKQKIEIEKVTHATTLEEILQNLSPEYRLNNFNLEKIDAIVVMYSTEGCVPCEVLKPKLKKLIGEYNAKGTNVGGIVIKYEQFPEFLKGQKTFPGGVIFKKDERGKFVKITSEDIYTIEQFKRNIDKYILGEVILPNHDFKDLTIILQRLLEKPNTISYNLDSEQFEINWDLTQLGDINNCGNYTLDNELINVSREVRKSVARKAIKESEAMEQGAIEPETKFPLDEFYKQVLKEYPFGRYYIKHLSEFEYLSEEDKKELEVDVNQILKREYLTMNEFDQLHHYIFAYASSIKKEDQKAEKTREVKRELRRRRGEFFQSYLPEEYKEMWKKYTKWLSNFYEGNAESYVFPAELPKKSKQILESWGKTKNKETIFKEAIPNLEYITNEVEKLNLPSYVKDWLLDSANKLEKRFQTFDELNIIYLPFNTPKKVFDNLLENHDYVVAYKSYDMKEDDFIKIVRRAGKRDLTYVILEAKRDAFLPLYIEPYGIATVLLPMIRPNIPYTDMGVIYQKKEPISVGHYLGNSEIDFSGKEPEFKDISKN